MTNSLRIISGKYRGRSFPGEKIVGTRPTMNRVKESLFAMIQSRMKDSICLDLFAGSGSLGLEALSNGAKICYFVDHNKIATDIISDNIKKCSIQEECHVLKLDYLSALLYFKDRNIKFDIIFLDPPYQSCFINDCLEKVIEYNLLSEEGMIVCEYENEEIKNDVLQVWKDRTYGNKKIIVYQK